MITDLTITQGQLLKSFINVFLPENERLIKNAKIELTFITEVITDIFDTWFHFNVGVDDVFEVLENYGYALSVIEPRKKSKTGQSYIKTNSGIIYVNVSPSVINELEMVTEYSRNKNSPTNVPCIMDILERLTIFKLSNN